MWHNLRPPNTNQWEPWPFHVVYACERGIKMRQHLTEKSAESAATTTAIRHFKCISRTAEQQIDILSSLFFRSSFGGDLNFAAVFAYFPRISPTILAARCSNVGETVGPERKRAIILPCVARACVCAPAQNGNVNSCLLRPTRAHWPFSSASKLLVWAAWIILLNIKY